MPIIVENGVSRNVTQEEFVAWAKANKLPVPSFSKAQPGLSKDEKDELAREKQYQEFQKTKINELNEKYIATQKQIEIARANGASESEIEKMNSEAKTIEIRLANRQTNLADSEANANRLEKIENASKNPAQTEAVSNPERDDTGDDLQTKARLEETKNLPPQEIDTELGEGGSTIQTFDDGSTLETFSDGSTYSVDSEGNVKTTPPKGDLAVDPAARRAAAEGKLTGAKDNLETKQLQSQIAQDNLADKNANFDDKKARNEIAQSDHETAKQDVEDRQAELDAAIESGDEDAIAEAQAALDDAQARADEKETEALEAQIAQDEAEEEVNLAQDEANAAAQDVDDAQLEVDDADAEFADTDYSSETEEDPTGEDQTAAETEEKYGAAGNVPDDEGLSGAQGGGDELGGGLIDGKPWEKKDTPATAQWEGVKDTRVVLRVPKTYLNSPLTSLLKENEGILFPYTPQLGYEGSASYGNAAPLHSNYTQYFFKNSSVSNINLSGKFTVQNEREAKIWLSIVHLGRALTKMPFGSEPQAGSAPPVCRLDGFGNMVFANVPVAVVSFKFELPDTVDYIGVYDGPFVNSMAPTISTITLTLQPMYSRDEIRNFTVEDFLLGKFKGKGYL